MKTGLRSSFLQGQDLTLSTVLLIVKGYFSLPNSEKAGTTRNLWQAWLLRNFDAIGIDEKSPAVEEDLRLSVIEDFSEIVLQRNGRFGVFV